ncbi:hypothetical protein L6452_14779 [Arctium lappa]|uniref:Uncharacterized protein n=1 Tax=Arctium lappa TaxID=4217 RepID=A0ACB9CM22_ARCLA|nr:hypothetical protein L6452_14779 [Arctium lappa]
MGCGVLTMVIVARHYREPRGGLGTPPTTMTCESDRVNVALSQSPNSYRGLLAARDYALTTMPMAQSQGNSFVPKYVWDCGGLIHVSYGYEMMYRDGPCSSGASAKEA